MLSGNGNELVLRKRSRSATRSSCALPIRRDLRKHAYGVPPARYRPTPAFR
jgi:hypothetical protein